MPDVERHVSQWQRKASIGKASAARVISCRACPQRHVMVAFIVSQLDLLDMGECIEGNPDAVPIFACHVV
jgi:hypothetical protein